jgi:CP family cyanate transporter-like MFS transporter
VTESPIPAPAPSPATARPGLPLLHALLFVALVTLIGLNLRAAMGAVPPLLGDITADLGLSGTSQGMLTSMAIVFTVLCAPLGHTLGARIGP